MIKIDIIETDLSSLIFHSVIIGALSGDPVNGLIEINNKKVNNLHWSWD